MSLSSFSVRRPVLTTMVTSIVVLLGGVAVQRVQIDLLPDIELPTVSVQTEYPGASPEVVERRVTQIIEEIVATVPGVVELRSQSAQSNSSVQASFAWGTPIDVAALDVQSTLEDELEELPEEIRRPRIRKFDISNFPVVLVGISSRLNPVQLTELVENQIRHRFSRLSDVAQVDVWGGYPREVRISLFAERVKALNLPLNDVLQAVRDANLDLPAGKIDSGRQEIVLRAPAEFKSVDEIRNTVVAIRNGAPVTVGQVAKVEDTYEKLTRLVRVNRKLGLRLAIRKQSNANTVEVARRILDQIDSINEEFPQVELVAVMNQGNFIERSIQNVARSVLYGGALAVVVLLFFLLSLRSTLVIAAAIPIAILGAFAMLFAAGFTINLTTLGGLALGVGMMVDSSIVVLENIFRRRDESGDDLKTAAISGAREMAPAIVASTITTLVVFLPLAFVRGVSGILFKELAYVVGFSLLCSLIVALTLLPMLATRVLPEERMSATSAGWVAFGERWLTRLNAAYARLLDGALKRPAATILMSLGALLVSAALYPLLGSEFLPPSDEGEIRISGKMKPGTRLSVVDQQTRILEEIVFPAVPETVSSVVSVGPSGWRPTDSAIGSVQIAVGDASSRSRSNTEIAADLRKKTAGKIAGMDVRIRAPQGSFILQRLLGGEEGLEIEVRGFDLERLDALAARVAKLAKTVPGITDLDVDREDGIPQREIQIDRAKIADMGLSVRDVTEVLQTAIAGTQAGEFRQEGDAYPILVRLANATELSTDELLGLTLTTASGEAVTLENLVNTEDSLGPLVINRKNQRRVVTISANVADRDMGSIAKDVQEKLLTLPMPDGFEVTLSGSFEEQEKAFAELVLSLILALLLVYMVLASQYESFRDPLIVMLSVPLAAIGVVVMLLATGTTLNVQSYIGCIMLGGIVVNNAILLVDQANRLLREGTPALDAVRESGRRRLRPILMTTLTTVLGLLPLALGIGEGADAQAPLARAVIGGLLGSTPITLLLVPVVYARIHRGKSA